MFVEITNCYSKRNPECCGKTWDVRDNCEQRNQTNISFKIKLTKHKDGITILNKIVKKGDR